MLLTFDKFIKFSALNFFKKDDTVIICVDQNFD